jgi:hypothetical protein
MSPYGESEVRRLRIPVEMVLFDWETCHDPGSGTINEDNGLMPGILNCFAWCYTCFNGNETHSIFPYPG